MNKAAEFVCLYGETCANPHYARGLCRSHYNKARNAGSLEKIGLPRKYSEPPHTLSNKNFEEKNSDMCCMWICLHVLPTIEE